MRFLYGFIGTFVGLLAACTGSVGDDGTDPMHPNDPPKTEVRVAVKDANTPQAGVRVIFQNADDSVVLDTATDAAGTASAELTAGNVTVIRTYPTVLPVPPEGQRLPEVITYVGVKGGDLIELGNAELATPATPSAIVVKVPDGANGTVTVKTPCGEGSGEAPNIAITVTSCGPMLDLYVTDDANSAFYMQRPFAENIDVSTGVLAGRLGAQLAATNIPADSQVNVEQRLEAGTFTLYSSGEKRVDDGPENVNVPQLTGVDQVLVTRIDTADLGRQLVGERSRYDGSTINVDASAHLAPYLADVDYQPATVTWTESGAGTADAVLLAYDVTRGTADGSAPALDAAYRRLVLAPHTGLALRVPQLPDARYNPSMADELGGALGLVKATGGYDALRERAFTAADLVDTAAVDGAITLSFDGARPGL